MDFFANNKEIIICVLSIALGLSGYFVLSRKSCPKNIESKETKEIKENFKNVSQSWFQQNMFYIVCLVIIVLLVTLGVIMYRKKGKSMVKNTQELPLATESS